MDYYWKGIPISSIPRAELEREFIRVNEELQDLHGHNLQLKIRHISDLMSVGKRRG